MEALITTLLAWVLSIVVIAIGFCMVIIMVAVITVCINAGRSAKILSDMMDETHEASTTLSDHASTTISKLE